MEIETGKSNIEVNIRQRNEAEFDRVVFVRTRDELYQTEVGCLNPKRVCMNFS